MATSLRTTVQGEELESLRVQRIALIQNTHTPVTATITSSFLFLLLLVFHYSTSLLPPLSPPSPLSSLLPPLSPPSPLSPTTGVFGVMYEGYLTNAEEDVEGATPVIIKTVKGCQSSRALFLSFHISFLSEY